MSEEAKEKPKPKICPFWGGHDCVGERCGLWTETHDDGGCAVPLLARLIGHIHWQGVNVQNNY